MTPDEADSREHLGIMYQIVTSAVRANQGTQSRDGLKRLGKYLLGLAICLENASRHMREHRNEGEPVLFRGGARRESEVIIANRERVAFQLRILAEESKSIGSLQNATEYLGRVRSLMAQIDAAANDLGAYDVACGK
jgi:hypothetical protein